MEMICDNFFNVDMKAVMEKHGIDKFDLVLTDPPYGSKIFDWDGKSLQWQKKWIREVMLLLKDKGSIYFFFAPSHMPKLLGWIEDNYNFYNVIAWIHKNQYMQGKKFGAKWTEAWDALIYFANGPSEYDVTHNLYERVGNTFNYIIANDPKEKLHPAHKPVKAVKKPLLASSNRGDWILDPFMGTGTTLKVAKMYERNAVGIEADETTFKIAKERISEDSHQHRLSEVYQ